MKISPVVGTPTIPNPSPTGLSPEKLAAIKAMASNQAPVEKVEKEERETIQLGQVPTSTTQRILMNTNRSTTRPIEQHVEENAAPLTEEVAAVPEPEVAISDKDVQAQPKPEAIGKVSPELAQLAKEKRALQIEREQLAKEKEALKGNNAEALIKKLQTSPLSVLQEHGITYEQLTNEILGQSQSQPDLKSFKEDLLKTIDEKLAGKDTQQEEAVYSFMKQEVDKLSFSSNDYKLIRETKSQDKVMDLVKRMWNEKGEILSETEAMDLIEAELKEEAKRYAKALGYVEQATAPVETPPAQATVQTKQKTLTNKDSARPLMSRRQRAIAAALGQK